MPRVIFQVDDREKALMVEAAHREYVSLSEWLRRAAQARLGGLVVGDENGRASGPGDQTSPSEATRSVSESSASPTTSPCRRSHLHHTNHGGNPCKECGWPT